jgi:hypothetical protein
LTCRLLGVALLPMKNVASADAVLAIARNTAVSRSARKAAQRIGRISE